MVVLQGTDNFKIYLKTLKKTSTATKPLLKWANRLKNTKKKV